MHGYTCDWIQVNCICSSGSYKYCHLVFTPLVECASDRPIFSAKITGRANLCSNKSQTFLNRNSSAWLSCKKLWLESLVVLNLKWVLATRWVATLQLCELHSVLSFWCSCGGYSVVFVLPRGTSINLSSSSSRPNLGRAPRRNTRWVSWSRKPTRNTWKHRKITHATPIKAKMRNIRFRQHANTITTTNLRCHHLLRI